MTNSSTKQNQIPPAVPEVGVLVDTNYQAFNRNPKEVIDNLFAIGGERGWYYGDRLWRFRTTIDQWFGGPGMRIGRPDTQLQPGDRVDFWRVVEADLAEGILVLYADTKLPGEAWLCFQVETSNKHLLVQKTVFRPNGWLGRLYWFSVLPGHVFVFKNMAKGIVEYSA